MLLVQMPALRLDILEDWFFPVPPGTCWNCITNWVTVAFFQICSSSVFPHQVKQFCVF